MKNDIDILIRQNDLKELVLFTVYNYGPLDGEELKTRCYKKLDELKLIFSGSINAIPSETRNGEYLVKQIIGNSYAPSRNSALTAKGFMKAKKDNENDKYTYSITEKGKKYIEEFIYNKIKFDLVINKIKQNN